MATSFGATSGPASTVLLSPLQLANAIQAPTMGKERTTRSDLRMERILRRHSIEARSIFGPRKRARAKAKYDTTMTKATAPMSFPYAWLGGSAKHTSTNAE